MNRPLWKRGSQLCEAEQLTRYFVPDGVEASQLGMTSEVCYTIRTPFGRLMLPLGTWIIYDEEGVRPVPQAVFEKNFRPLTVGGRAVAMGERVVRKIIGG